MISDLHVNVGVGMLNHCPRGGFPLKSVGVGDPKVLSVLGGGGLQGAKPPTNEVHVELHPMYSSPKRFQHHKDS